MIKNHLKIDQDVFVGNIYGILSFLPAPPSHSQLLLKTMSEWEEDTLHVNNNFR